MDGDEPDPDHVQLNSDLDAVISVRLLMGLWVALALLATHDRIGLWGDEPALWADAVAKAPEKPRPWINLGQQYALEGADTLAEQAFQRGLAAATATGRAEDERIHGRGIAAANIALLRCKAGDPVGARAVLDRVWTDRPISTDMRRVSTWISEHRIECSSSGSSF